VCGRTKCDARKTARVTEGNIELDRSVAEATAPEPRGAIAQEERTATAVSFDARFGGLDVPSGGIECGLRAHSRDGEQREQRDSCAETIDVVCHARW